MESTYCVFFFSLFFEVIYVASFIYKLIGMLKKSDHLFYDSFVYKKEPP